MTPGPHRVNLVDDRWANVRHIVETVAILAAGAWAIYTFLYEQRIVPASQPAALAPSISIARLGRDAHREILVVKNSLTNVGKTEIEIAADGYDVWGYRYGSHARIRSRSTPAEAAYDDDMPHVSRTLLKAFIELRDAATHGSPRHITLEPNASITLSYTLVIPRGAYDTLFAQNIASPLKSSATYKMDVRIERESDGSLWLGGNGAGRFTEDDNSTEFALNP